MLAATLRGAAQRFGEAPALLAPGGWALSYADLDRLSEEVAAGLAARGVGEGSVAGLLLPASPEYVVAYLALAKLGAVCAGLNPRLSARERQAAIAQLSPDVVLATEEAADGVSGGAEIVGVRESASPPDVLAQLRTSGRGHRGAPPDRDRPVAIAFTSGTTGAPKGAVFTGRQLAAITEMDVGTEWGGGGPTLVATSLAHVGFMTKLPGYLRRAARMQLVTRWRAADVLRIVAGQRIPVLGGVGAQVALLMRVPGFAEYDLSCVRLIVAGGGPSSPQLVREARERFAAPYSTRYSSTESGGLGTLTTPDMPDDLALHTVGRPRPGIDLEVRDDAGRAVATGEYGEVCLRSPAMMTGYWRDPEASAVALAGGWLHTGDLGYLDEAGCLRLTGRANEMYIRGGYNVYPMEVEAVLLADPDVLDVVVVPRPDEVMGEIGVAVVVPRDPARPPSLVALRLLGAESLASYKLPEALRIVAALPLTSMHKIDRRALAQQEAGEAWAPRT